MKYFVNAKAEIGGDGSSKYPFRRISDAAAVALPGDEVIVAEGVYRENVNPVHGGTEQNRITYRSESMKAAVITGAEEVKNWERYEGNVWKAIIPNALFGAYNPFTTLVQGDWLVKDIFAHTGDVYLNEKSMYEVSTLEKVSNPELFMGSWDYNFTVYTWYTEQKSNTTVIYANFQGKNPNEENVEVSARKNCFYPAEEGIGYITLSGFTVRQAATQWAPPTAYQEGMIGPHWSKGWVIEDCEVYESKCSGISLGKYLQPNNDNKWMKTKHKDGTQTERDCICQALREGWSKENIGSHIVRRCNIHDCGQTGIVGHLGGVFSTIENNEIHHINNKQNIGGAEIGGIKMHAAIDVTIRNNHFHHCTRGLWLDWQAQGTRVTGNLFHDNCVPNDENLLPGFGPGEDIFIEVSHGPTLVDHNILLSDRALKLPTQGVALVHNLIAGAMTAVGRGVDNGSIAMPSPRYTPYHLPHSTEIEGFMSILHGDMRFYNNVFIQQSVREKLQKHMSGAVCEWDDDNLFAGTAPYEDYPTYEEYEKMFDEYCGMGTPSDRYYRHLPVWAGGNVYCNGAKSMSKEKAVVVSNEIKAYVEQVDGSYVFRTNLSDCIDALKVTPVCTETLGMAFEPEQRFENTDGTPIVFDEDYSGNKTGLNTLAGPFSSDALMDLK